jgi:tetratricopeptide (TPR) repeat protein
MHKEVLSCPIPDDEDKKQALIAEVKSRGNAAFKAKRLDEADVLYSRAIKIDPKGFTFYGNRSATRLGMGKYKEALEDADSAIGENPNWAKGYFRKGQACEKLKRYRDAEDAYQLSVAKDPDAKGNKSTLKKVKEMAEAAENAPAEEEKAKAEAAAKAEKKPPPPVMSKPSTISKPKATEAGAEKMRGYKVRADGTKTTFFNNELTEEDRALIGDIAPKKVENVVQVNTDGVGSAWSNGTTYEERDRTKWAKARVKELVLESVFTIPADELAALGEGSGDDNGTFAVKKVTNIEGDASVPIIRGKSCYHALMFVSTVMFQRRIAITL